MTPRHSLLAAAVLSFSALTASALDLREAWQAARDHAPQAAVALAARQAGEARRAQADALWRPTVALSASAGLAGAQTAMGGAHFSAPGLGASDGVGFATSVRAGASTRWALSARQALLNPERRAQSRQLQLSADMAELGWQAERQDLMLFTAQRYFDTVLAHSRLDLLRQQQSSAEKTLVEAKDRFALGDKPVTDTHEAAARTQALRAQVLQAESELTLARSRLADLMGPAGAAASPVQPPLASDLAPDALPALAYWQDQVMEKNTQLRLQQVAVELAQQEVAKHQAQAATTLDLVAQAGGERLSGHGSFGAASTGQTQQMVGVQLNMPLYTGGYRSAKLEEALRQEDKARAELEMSRQQLRQQTQAAWLGLQTGRAHLAALGEARVASQARLDATALGRQVGDRTTLELLQAQNDAASADLALVQARTDLLMNRLRLYALAGQLDEAALNRVNAHLQP